MYDDVGTSTTVRDASDSPPLTQRSQLFTLYTLHVVYQTARKTQAVVSRLRATSLQAYVSFLKDPTDNCLSANMQGEMFDPTLSVKPTVSEPQGTRSNAM